MAQFSIKTALEAAFRKRAGLSLDTLDIDDGRSNSAPLHWQNAAGTSNISALNVDGDDAVLLNNENFIQAPREITINIGANANQGSQQIWGTNMPCRVVGITETHKTAGTNGSAVTAYIEKLTDGQASGSGVTMMTGTFDLKGTANTPQTAVLSTAHARADGRSQDIILAAGDRVGIVTTGTLTTLAGVQVTLWVVPGGKGHHAIYHAKTNSDIATQTFYIANRPGGVVTAAFAFWGTKGTDSGAVTLDITKDATGTAAGAGTSILLAAQSLKTAINTFTTLALAASAATLRLSAAGDRLSFKLTGTPTALADLTIVVVFAPVENRKEVTYVGLASDIGVDLPIWTPSRPYFLEDVSAVWGTASTSMSVLPTRDSGTTAPGGGTGLITDDTNKGFLTSATAATPVWGTLAANRLRWIAAGDRLSVKQSVGTSTSLAGFCMTASFRPR